MSGRKEKPRLSSFFKVGAISIAFLILGYQVAIFVQRAAVLKIEANRDHPDTVYVCAESLPRDSQSSDYQQYPESRLGKFPNRGYANSQSSSQMRVHGSGGGRSNGSGDRGVAGHGSGGGRSNAGYSSGGWSYRSNAEHSPKVQAVRKATRKVESFRFNPNTISCEDLQRLGFSEKQAESIVHYREKGGSFRRKSDFAKSYVVADSVYKRLEKFIDIPLVDINKADSAAFDALPGIGGYFARKMVEYREKLGGYSFPEQLMDIYHFDQEKYDALKDLIICSPPEHPFALWSLGIDELRKHPYIRNYQTAKAIVLYRENTPRDSLSVLALGRAGILDDDIARKLSRCALAP